MRRCLICHEEKGGVFLATPLGQGSVCAWCYEQQAPGVRELMETPEARDRRLFGSAYPDEAPRPPLPDWDAPDPRRPKDWKDI